MVYDPLPRATHSASAQTDVRGVSVFVRHRARRTDHGSNRSQDDGSGRTGGPHWPAGASAHASARDRLLPCQQTEWIHARFRRIWGTATSNTPCATLNSHRSDSARSGAINYADCARCRGATEFGPIAELDQPTLCPALDMVPRVGAPPTRDHPNEQTDTLAARHTALKAALLFLSVNTWEVRLLLSLKRATQCLDVTRPCAAHHWGFKRYWRAFGVDFGKLGSGGRGYGSFRIHR